MKKGRKRLYDVLFALCILVFVGSGCMLVQKIAAQKKNDSRLEDLSSLVTRRGRNPGAYSNARRNPGSQGGQAGRLPESKRTKFRYGRLG